MKLDTIDRLDEALKEAAKDGKFTALVASDAVGDAIDSLRDHDARVSELLAANTALVLQRRHAEQKLAEVQDELREYEDLLAKQHERTTKADTLWRAAHPGKELVLPDLGDLIEWLVKRGDYVNEVLRANDGLSAALRKERARNPVHDAISLRDFQAALLVALQREGVPADILQVLTTGDNRGTVSAGVLWRALTTAFKLGKDGENHG